MTILSDLMADIADDVAELRSLFSYEPETGIVTRRRHAGTTARAGQVVGSLSGNGYLIVGIARRRLPLHRVIWALVHGSWPSDQIDHINGVKTDNRFCNLRAADRAQNSQNIAIRTDNTSGHIGVSFFRRRQMWQAYINVRGKRENLGYFDTAEAAASAYLVAKQRLHTFNPVPRFLSEATQ